MTLSQRSILKRVGVGALPQPDEKAFTLLVKKRLEQHERVCSTPANDGFMNARAQLAASIERVNAPLGIRCREQQTEGWLGAQWAQESAHAVAPVHGERQALIVKTKLGYARSAAAIAAVSSAVLGLAGSAAFIYGSDVANVVAQPTSSRRAALDNTNDRLELASTMMIAAITASSDTKQSGPLYDEGSEPLVAEPPSLARPSEMPITREAPAIQPAAPASEMAIPKRASRTLSKATEDVLLGRASRHLGLGDISGARSILKNLAYQGSERAAFGLAETYEESFLRSLNVNGLKPEPGLAREWYEKAASLGSEDAARRLKSLN
jgi:hypothetical protein